MNPKVWRLLVSCSLRLFLGVTTAAATNGAVLWIIAIAVAFAIPAPRIRRIDRVDRTTAAP